MISHKATHRRFRKYKTIVVDAPKPMDVEKLKSLPIEELASTHSHLYLWTTNALVRDAFEILDAWGFSYKTMITWVKPESLGSGHYWKDNTEHCLFAVKGIKDVSRNDMWNVIVAPERVHSGKPPEFMACVEEMSPWPRLDYFGTGKRKGWRVWDRKVNENEQSHND